MPADKAGGPRRRGLRVRGADNGIPLRGSLARLRATPRHRARKSAGSSKGSASRPWLRRPAGAFALTVPVDAMPELFHNMAVAAKAELDNILKERSLLP